MEIDAQGRVGTARCTPVSSPQDPLRVVQRDMAGVNVSLAREKIGALKSVGRSLMPEGLLADKTAEQVSDLFAYLRITQPLPVKAAK